MPRSPKPWSLPATTKLVPAANDPDAHVPRESSSPITWPRRPTPVRTRDDAYYLLGLVHGQTVRGTGARAKFPGINSGELQIRDSFANVPEPSSYARASVKFGF